MKDMLTDWGNLPAISNIEDPKEKVSTEIGKEDIRIPVEIPTAGNLHMKVGPEE